MCELFHRHQTHFGINNKLCFPVRRPHSVQGALPVVAAMTAAFANNALLLRKKMPRASFRSLYRFKTNQEADGNVGMSPSLLK